MTEPLDLERETLIAELLKVTWPDGGHDGLPTKKTAGMLADGLLASDWLTSKLATLRDEVTDRANVEADLRAQLAAIRQLFAGGPDTPCLTTWRSEPSMPDCSAASIECVEVPMDELRRVLGPP